jgi:hypothetical protein
MFLQIEPCDCFDCMEKENRLDDIKYWFKALTDQIFGIEDFDSETLSYYVNELTLRLGIDFPKSPVSVVRKDHTIDIDKMIDVWKHFNNQYLANLEKTGT